MIEFDLRDPTFRGEVVSLAFRMGIIDTEGIAHHQSGDLGSLVSNILQNQNASEHITNLFLGRPYHSEVTHTLGLYAGNPEAFAVVLNQLSNVSHWIKNEEELSKAAVIYSHPKMYEASSNIGKEELPSVMPKLAVVGNFTDVEAMAEVKDSLLKYHRGDLMKIAAEVAAGIAFDSREPQKVKVFAGLVANDEYHTIANRFGPRFVDVTLNQFGRQLLQGKYKGLSPEVAAKQYLENTRLIDLVHP